MWWLWWWLMFVIVLFVLPLGYGWGYRRWGPPYVSRRRATTQHPAPETATWGLLAALVWASFTVALIWLIAVLVAA